jgi:hypothetical protein
MAAKTSVSDFRLEPLNHTGIVEICCCQECISEHPPPVHHLHQKNLGKVVLNNNKPNKAADLIIYPYTALNPSR